MNNMKPVDQAFSAAIVAADFDKAARLLTEGADIDLIPTVQPDERGIYEDTTTH
jgi:hypothetical protein